MSAAAQHPDPRREHLRRQAILRRNAVFERLSGTRALMVGGVVAATCVLAGYFDASAHTRSSSSGGALGSGVSGNYGTSSSGGGSSNYSTSSSGGSSSQSLLGGGSPPSSSSGGGSVISGGS